ncbi:MAG: hypothetical protein LCH84_00500 [Gemmatimonadetes bacterium]|nr:hypothetical protein [Gemmatimonadota bacterium]
MRSLRAALTVLAVVSTSAHAQSTTSPFAGRWNIEITPTGPIVTPSTRGRLTITARGDSLEAHVEWTPGADGRVSPNRTMRGAIRGDTATFQDETEGSVSAESRTAGIRAIITWVLTPRESGLVGAISFEVPGMSLPLEAIPVRGQRATDGG